jgi:hypothetical protein
MQWARVSGKVHKWLALLMAVQILFWFVSGLFFAVVPIETVRSEHRIAELPVQPVSLDAAAAGLRRIAASQETAADRIELRSLMGEPVAFISSGDGRPRLYDLSTGRRISPIPSAMAVAIAERDHDGEGRATRVSQVTGNTPEYRGPLPAWRVDFDDGANRALYVAADTGAVTAHRSTLWRVYDFLWSLHIMDFKNHEDFNTPLLIVSTALSLVVIVTGFIMFPSRLGWHSWRKRRKARRDAALGASSV